MIGRDAAISFPMLGGEWFNPPASVSVFGREIYFYGILIAIGFFLAILYCARRAESFGIKADDFYDMALWIIPLSILGARLYYVAFRWDYYGTHLREIPAVWEGGLAIYGGILAGVLVGTLFCRRRRIRVLAMLDLMSFGVVIGQILGRWGNFFNREAYGAETEIFCRMGLRAPDGTTVFVHPTFLYESLWNLAGFFILTRVRRHRRYDGQCALTYFFWYGLGRLWIEGLRTDSLYLGPVRVSQALSLALAAVAGIILFRRRRHGHVQ